MGKRAFPVKCSLSFNREKARGAQNVPVLFKENEARALGPGPLPSNYLYSLELRFFSS
jgi:hypothetical protein